MKTNMMYAAGDVRVEDVPVPHVQQPTDSVLRVVASCICGTDLHPYHNMESHDHGEAMGHEVLGRIEELGEDVTGFEKGDLVVVPFFYADNTCPHCREGWTTSCVNGGFMNGGQAEYVHIPQAQGSMFKLPDEIEDDSPLIPSLLTLSDVYGTGYHAAVMGGVNENTTVTVIGDGAVGLLAVLAAKKRGAQRIILMGRHKVRTDLGVEFGATDVVPERGEEGIAKVRELTNGEGTHVVLECVGLMPAFEMSAGVVRSGGVISRVGAPQYEDAPVGAGSFFGRNITLTGGPAPTRAYMDELLPDILDGTLNPGRVFDVTVGLDDVPEGYRAMDNREALKVLIRP
ncbi:alcohol dehydrogenase catalytic domain-containing protein [Salibacterium halotolerans]|uniref:Threonine dehydrogenase n=1 Tax=Salibacterium halotolerans TaxID=1884432 RepID=A0A1I5V8T2_9BACI|nr:alcohol dehydrogenase catalytic domain-containing protein [Salibacterium halotolerans]SFQ03840.1 Threonine dehydrogenase [Salibacterium halotolerans]